jgi:hypothetical protein
MQEEITALKAYCTRSDFLATSFRYKTMSLPVVCETWYLTRREHI